MGFNTLKFQKAKRWLLMNYSQDLIQNDLKIVKIPGVHCEKFTVSVIEGIFPTRETSRPFFILNDRQQIGDFVRFFEESKGRGFALSPV